VGIRTRMQQRQTMPRVRPEVEANKLQRPELARLLQQRLGLKQSHTIPTIGSELLPIIVVDDLTQQAVRPEYWCAQFASIVNTGVNPSNWYLINPPGSAILAKPKRWSFSPGHGSVMNMCLPQIGTPPPIAVKGGRRLVAGTQVPTDISPTTTGGFPAVLSLYSGEVGGVPPPTFYEQYMNDSITTPGAHDPYMFEMPKLLLYPGSALQLFLDASPVGVDTDLYIEWTEEQLT